MLFLKLPFLLLCVSYAAAAGGGGGGPGAFSSENNPANTQGNNPGAPGHPHVKTTLHPHKPTVTHKPKDPVATHKPKKPTHTKVPPKHTGKGKGGNIEETSKTGNLATKRPIATGAPHNKVVPCRAAYGNNNGCSYCDNAYAMEPMPMDKTPIKKFTNIKFASSEGMKGYTIWYSIPQPKENCKTLIVTPRDGIKPAFGTSGFINVVAESAGCYGSTVQASGYGVAQCCGDDECMRFGADILKKRKTKRSVGRRNVNTIEARDDNESIEARTAEPVEPLESLEEGSADDDSIKAPKEGTSLWKRFTTFNTPHTVSEGKAMPVVPAKDPNALNCEAAKPIDGANAYHRLGLQQVNDTQFFCNGLSGQPCRIDLSTTASSSSSYSVSNSSTKTKTTGGSVALTAGWNNIIGPTYSITGTVSHDESNALESSLSGTTEKGTSMTVSYDMVQAANTYAKVTWVPLLTCKGYTVTCSDGDHNIEHCVADKPDAGLQMLMYVG